MRKLTILVDMDDTIEYLLKEWVEWLNARHGLNVSVDDVRCWNIAEAFPELTAEQVYDPLYYHELWMRVKPMPDAQEVLKKLIEDGHEVYITTSSNYSTIATKITWVLFRYFPYICWDHVIVAAKKQMIRGDVMVDDGPHNLEGGDYEKLLMNAPHNRDYDEKSHGMTRVFNWSEIYDEICAIADRETEES